MGRLQCVEATDAAHTGSGCLDGWFMSRAHRAGAGRSEPAYRVHRELEHRPADNTSAHCPRNETLGLLYCEGALFCIQR